MGRGRAPALVQVRIDGPVLLLMGPIGLFFARFSRYLLGCGIPVTKVAFPLREFGFPSDVCVPYSKGMDSWRPFLRRLIEERGIRHIFMYGDFIIPHRIAIEEASSMAIRWGMMKSPYIKMWRIPRSSINRRKKGRQESIPLLYGTQTSEGKPNSLSGNATLVTGMPQPSR